MLQIPVKKPGCLLAGFDMCAPTETLVANLSLCILFSLAGLISSQPTPQKRSQRCSEGTLSAAKGVGLGGGGLTRLGGGQQANNLLPWLWAPGISWNKGSHLLLGRELKAAQWGSTLFDEGQVKQVQG